MAQQTMTEREVFIQHFEREHETTLKVLRAFPPNQLDFKPHPRSSTTRDLMWMMVQIQKIDDLVRGKMEEEMPPAPKSLEELITAQQKIHQEFVSKVRGLSDDQLNGTIRVPTGKNTTTEVRLADALWYTIFMLVHHRGQLSVYLRMAGGKVPSIYGPSADEPWS